MGALLISGGLLRARWKPAEMGPPLTRALYSAGSFKFGQKIFYVNYLSELSEHVKLEQLGIPRQVLK